MNGQIVVNKNLAFGPDFGIAGLVLPANTHKILNNRLTLTQGVIELGANNIFTVNNELQIPNPVRGTFNLGAAGNSTFIFNGTANSTLSLTSATVQQLNALEHRSAFRLTLRNNDLVMQGTMGLYYPGQVRLFGTGTMALAARKITFNGTTMTEGGAITATTGTGSLAGDAAATLFFNAPRPSFVQMSQSGSENNLGGMVLNAAAAPAPMSPLVTVMNPVVIQTVTLGTVVNQGGIIRVGNGATLTADNPIQTFTGAFGSAVPVAGVASNFIDAPGTPSGGRYIQRNVAIPGTRVFPIGVDRQSPAGIYAPSYTPITVNIPSAAMGTDTYTVSATTAVTNLVATIPNRVNVQWSINKATSMPAPGTVSFRWASNTYTAGDNLTLGLTTDINSTTVPTTASVRRWTGASYLKESTSRILALQPAPAPADATIDVVAGGTLSINNPFVISNDPFPIFWVGRGVTTTWADVNNWSATSGGLGGVPGGGSIPGPSDFVTFDQNALVPSPTISTGFPLGVQRLTILGTAQPTFVQATTSTFVLQQSSTVLPNQQNESLYIDPNAGLTLQGLRMQIRPQPAAGNFEGATVFGRLSLLQNGTFEHTVNNANSFITIANGGRLVIDRSSGVISATTGLVKANATTLNYQTVAPYATTPPNGLNGTLVYEDVGATPIDLDAVFNINGELGASLNGVVVGQAVFPGNIIINRTGSNRRVLLPFAAFTISSSLTVSSGDLVLASGQVLNVGSSLGVGESGSRTLNVIAPNGNIIGDPAVATQLRLAGPGSSVLRFAGDPVAQRSLGILRIDEPGAAVTLNSSRNLIMTGAPGLDMLRASNTLGLHVSPTDTITIGNAASGQIDAVNGGRTIVSGRMVVSTQGTFANNRLSGLVIGTTGTLEIQDAMPAASGSIANLPVTYLAPTSLLTYTGNRPTTTRTTAEFPVNFGGSLLLNKAPFTQLAMGGLGNSTIITGASVRLREGFLTLQGHTLAVSGATLRMEAGRLQGDFGAAGTSALIYNSPTPGQLFMEPTQAFLAKLEINNAGSLTLSTNSNLTIGTSTGPLSNPPSPYSQQPTGANNNIGQLRLDVGTGGLVMNGSSVIFANVGANSGQLITSSTSGGAIIGDNNSTLRFESPRASTLRMAGGTSGTLRDILVNSGTSITPGVPLVTLVNNLTVRRTTFANALAPAAGGGTLLLANSTVELKITDPLLGLTGAPPPTNDNNYVDVSGGGRLTMTVPMSSTATFIIGLQNFSGLANRYAPVRITNTSAQEDYTVSATSAIVNLPLVYPDRVNVQWNISKSTSAPVANTIRFDWDQLHENTSFFVAPTFVRNTASVQQWNGSSTYNLLGSTPAGAAPTFNNTSTVPVTNFATNQPFIVSGPAPATNLVFTTSATATNQEGFNQSVRTIVNGSTVAIHFSAFNGFNQRSSVSAITSIIPQISGISGAIFALTNTTATLNPVGNPISSTFAQVTITWLNPIPGSSTTAALTLSAIAGQTFTTSQTIILTITAPPLGPSTIAYARVENASNATFGFNGGGLGQFNITGGVAFPVDFGFYTALNNLANTTATTQVTMSVVSLTPGATFTVTNDIAGSIRINPINVGPTVNGGRMNPIINWTNAGTEGGVVQALAILTANPGTPFAFSTSVIVNVGTNATVPVRLGYSVNSGDISDPVRAVSGVNGGKFGQVTTFNQFNPITSGIPFPLNFASFAQNGMVVRPPITPTQVQLGIQPAPINPGALFSIAGGGPITIASTNGIASLIPRITWVNPPIGSGYADAILSVNVVSGTMLISTDVTISIFTTGNVAVNIAMSQVTSNGVQGVNNNALVLGSGGTALPVPIQSGVPFNIDYGFYNAWGLPASGYPANGSFTVDVTSVSIPGENVTVDGSPSSFLPFAVTQGRVPNIILNWRSRTAASPTFIDVTVRLNAGFTGIATPTTTVTIRLSSTANVPVYLGLSQLSSTSSVGVNGGNALVSGQAFNVDAGLFDGNGSLTPSLSNVSANLSVSTPPGFSGSFNILGNISGVFVNQAGIRYNGVTINWTNPPSGNATTRVRLTISTTNSAGIYSTFADIVISAADVFPRISNLSPANGGAGTVVQITGVNFTGVNSVLFNGSPAASFIVQGDGLIVATAPSGVSTGPITVSRPAFGAVPAGSGVSPTPFTIGLQPVITSFSPTAGGIGTRVRINGANLAGVTFVRLADVTAIVDPDPANSSPTGQFVSVILTGPLTVTTGSLDIARSGPVTMATVNGVVVSSLFFTYNPPPVITSVTPNSAIVSGQDIPIIIRGRGFNFPLMPSVSNPFEQQSGVYFSTSIAPLQLSPAQKISVQSITPTEIRATISGSFNNLEGQRFVFVQNVDAQYTSISFQLIRASAPVITSISPSTTSANGVAYTAVITGSNFFGQAGTTVTAVGSNGQSTNLIFSAVSPTQLNVIIPDALNSLGQTLLITVRNSDTQSATTSIFVRDPGRPSITSLTPPRAVVGSSSVTVSINGSNFFLNSIVTFGNTELTTILSRSTTNIVVVIPANLLTTFGAATILVRNGVGGFAGPATFFIGYPRPEVISVVTASGTNPGQPVTSATVFPFQLAINGTGFRINPTVTFNGTALQVISTSPTQVIVAVPSGLNGTQGVFPVVISNADGQSSQGLFTIGTPNGPIITAISPDREIAASLPFVLTIDGRNFSVSLQGQLLAGARVLFNGQPLQVIQASTTRIVAQVPGGANSQEGTATIQIVNSDLQTASFPMTILCAQCPIVRSYTPTTVRPTNTYGFDVVFTLNGSNFRPGASVTVGGTPLTIVRVDSTTITAIAPPGFFFGNGEIIVTNLDGRRFTVPGRLILGVRDAIVTPMTGRAYPNPVEDMLTFETDITKATQLRVRISDMLGRTVTSFTQQVGTGRFTHQLDVSGLPTGVYIFEMNDGERRFTEKIIKR
jgi:hypothetical protein